MWQFPAVFVALFALDFVYARYNIASTTGRALASAHYAALIILLGGFGIVSYTQDHALLIPAALGAWAGTFCAVHFKDKEIVMAWNIYRIKNLTARRAAMVVIVPLCRVIFVLCSVLQWICDVVCAAGIGACCTWRDCRKELRDMKRAERHAWHNQELNPPRRAKCKWPTPCRDCSGECEG